MNIVRFRVLFESKITFVCGLPIVSPNSSPKPICEMRTAHFKWNPVYMLGALKLIITKLTCFESIAYCFQTIFLSIFWNDCLEIIASSFERIANFLSILLSKMECLNFSNPGLIQAYLEKARKELLAPSTQHLLCIDECLCLCILINQLYSNEKKPPQGNVYVQNSGGFAVKYRRMPFYHCDHRSQKLRLDRAFCSSGANFWSPLLVFGLPIWLPKKLHWLYSLLTIASRLFSFVPTIHYIPTIIKQSSP